MNRFIIQAFLIIFLVQAGSSQFGTPLNDNCIQSFRISNVDNFCSDNVESFTTTGATEESTMVAGCISSFNPEGVWYNFTALTRFVRITVEGDGDNLNLTNPLVSFFEGSCDALVELNCANSVNNVNTLELVREVTPGRRYFLLVGSTSGFTGNFRLCINSFNQNPEPLQDCSNARILCDKSHIGVESVSGSGNIRDNLNFNLNPAIAYPACGVQEDASNWYKWTCDEPGTLTFTITPLKQYDDIDFVVYELPSGINDCGNKIPIRTMISGQNLGRPFAEWEVCVGPTGLEEEDNDLGEACGCQSGDNNFASAIDMEEGKSYALVVMNFSESGVGYELEWGGTGTFLGPVPEFSVEPITGLRCDQAFTIEDRSRDNGNPLEYSWYFGEGATPEFSDESGPFDVEYSTFGQKFIVLSVTDPVNGCEVTEIFEVFAEACCEDLPDVEINLDYFNDPTCPEFSDGSFGVSAAGGANVGFQYSINNSPFVFGSEFFNLPENDFEITAVDQKGCQSTLIVSLMDPNPIIVDAGLDSLVELGNTIDLEGNVIETDRMYEIIWDWDTENSEVSCTNCLDPTVRPAGQTQFTLTVIDEFGCIYTDVVNIGVDPNYPIYIPNVFSPNNDGYNDFFTAFGGIAIDFIVELKIFDRWGNLVFLGNNFLPNDPAGGWDGNYRGSPAASGVYAYMFDVQFIDNGPPIKYAGDITLLR